ncbi:hypothetical protein [Aminithiophilus ramosus]|nr:hypothetical protein [Aminithiophilus ramosus]
MGETDDPRPRTREESFEIQAPVETDMIVAKRSPIQAAPDEIELVVRRGGHRYATTIPLESATEETVRIAMNYLRSLAERDGPDGV